MTTTFSVTAKNLIDSSLRKTGVFGSGDIISASDYNNCLMALNILIKGLITQGLPLWAIENIIIPLVQGQSAYNIGPSATGTGAVVTDRPTKIKQAIYTNGQGNNTVMNVISRYDYNNYGQPAAQGVPNQLWYLPSIPNGVVTLYDVPLDDTATVTIVSQRTFEDVALISSTILDFPQEWYAPLLWLLADEIQLEYQVKPSVMQAIMQKAVYWRETVSGWGAEDVPVRFVPSSQYSSGGR